MSLKSKLPPEIKPAIAKEFAKKTLDMKSLPESKMKNPVIKK